MAVTKHTIDPYEYASLITDTLPKGILLTTKANGEVNTMAIGWGLIGNVWGRPMFVAFIRHTRHSHELLEASGEFTVNVPDGQLPKDMLRVAGFSSGRDVDKFAELGLTMVESDTVGAPGILECPLTLECKIIYKQELDKDGTPQDVLERWYPDDVTDISALASTYSHTVYYGEIVDSYIIEELPEEPPA